MGGGKTSVYVTGNYAYTTGDSGLQVIDISDPSNPIVSGWYPLYSGAVHVSGGYAYVGGLHILDVSQPSSLTFSGYHSTPGSGQDVYVTGEYAYVADGSSGLQVINISEMPGPALEGHYDSTGFAEAVYVSGNYAYMADGGLKIINIIDPSSPSLEGSYDTASSGYDIHVSGNYAYVASGSGLRIMNISDPSNPYPAGSCDTPGIALGVHVSGNYAYVAGYSSGLQIINISNPSSPFLAGSYDTPGYARSVYVSGNYAYVADYYSGLQIINISNPSSPFLAGSYDTPGYARDVYVSGNHAYVADGFSGLQIINISNPLSPFLEGSYDTPGYASDVHVSGNYAYVAEVDLLIIDINDPSSPVLEGSYHMQRSAESVHAAGNYVYVALGYSGLQIVKQNGSVSNVSVVDPATITATYPAGLYGGPYHVLVTNPGGQSEEAYLYNGYHVTSSSALVDYYCDNDGDTYINEISDGTCSGAGCQPAGCTTSPGSDCNDSNAAINPDTYWYQDYDEDGFGNSSISIQQCNDPSGAINYVLDSNDYNDGDPYTGAPVQITGAAVPYYSSLQAAYDAASDGDTIRVIAGTFNEDLFIDRNISVTFECGYDGSFSTNTGFTTLAGDMTISYGALNIENFLVE